MSEAQLDINLGTNLGKDQFSWKETAMWMRCSKVSKHLAFVQKLNLYVANYCKLIYVIATLMIHSHSVQTNFLNQG